MSFLRLERHGYYAVRELPCGVTALRDYMNTTDIVVGIDGQAYRRRYSFDSPSIARAALDKWNGYGDPPGPWLKCKGPDELRIGPGWANKE
jgi:hypothetical protein